MRRSQAWRQALLVTTKGRDPEGWLSSCSGQNRTPHGLGILEQAFNEKTTIVGTVIAAVKGGLSVDVGVRAFYAGDRAAACVKLLEMEKIVGQEIRCRITKLDVTEEDIVVVDRRVISEEEDQVSP